MLKYVHVQTLLLTPTPSIVMHRAHFSLWSTQHSIMTRLVRFKLLLAAAAQQECTCGCSFEWAEGYTKPFGMYAWRPDGSKDRELKVLCFNMLHVL